MASKDIKKVDIIGNRIMTVVFGAMLMMIAMVFIDRGLMTITENSIRNRFIIDALVIAIPSILLAGALFYFFRARGKNEKTMRTFSANFVLGLSVVLFVLGLAIRLFPTKAIDAGYVLIPVMAVLYVVYYCYQRSCFTQTTMVAVSGVALYVIYKIGDYVSLSPFRLPLCIVLAILAVLYMPMMKMAEKNNGLLKMSKLYLRVSDMGTSFVPHVMASLVAAAAFVAAGIHAAWAFYGVLALVGVVVLCGIYYTMMLAQSERAKG